MLQGREPDYDNVRHMPYLQAAIDETLRSAVSGFFFFVFLVLFVFLFFHSLLSLTFHRMYPPVQADLKEALEDDVLPNGIRVPKGRLPAPVLFISTHAIWIRNSIFLCFFEN